MKDKVATLAGAAAFGCLALVGCGGSNDNMATPPAASNPPTPTKQLDTAEVLAIIHTDTSDTSQPFMVNGGAVMVTPVNDETGEPITVNGT